MSDKIKDMEGLPSETEYAIYSEGYDQCVADIESEIEAKDQEIADLTTRNEELEAKLIDKIQSINEASTVMEKNLERGHQFRADRDALKKQVEWLQNNIRDAIANLHQDTPYIQDALECLFRPLLTVPPEPCPTCGTVGGGGDVWSGDPDNPPGFDRVPCPTCGTKEKS